MSKIIRAKTIEMISESILFVSNLSSIVVEGGKKEYDDSLCFIHLYRLYLRVRIVCFESLHGLHAHALCPQTGQLYLSNVMEDRTCSNQSKGVVNPSFRTLPDGTLPSEESITDRQKSLLVESHFREKLPKRIEPFLYQLDFSNITILSHAII